MAKKLRGLGGRNYGGSKKGTNMNDLLKQAQKAQEEMDNLEDTFKNIEVSASAGGGAINVVATCDYRIKSIEVDQELKEEDFEIVQDLIIAGVNEALSEVTKKTRRRNGKGNWSTESAGQYSLGGVADAQSSNKRIRKNRKTCFQRNDGARGIRHSCHQRLD